MTADMHDTTPDLEDRTLLRVVYGQRRHVLGILDGLDAEALRRPVLPAGCHCLWGWPSTPRWTPSGSGSVQSSTGTMPSSMV
ncbi:hypothetical protein O1Q96_20390 [Streptomyces sp. Qhu-G9]|uniref:hypothetical protein n=1 Tax=Streptomyces sp. Qhu-G9 TaxID=3452799 RepID=UPI0022AC17FF|nr:hypothetical protein [Streptomyces aurantiacus]WAU81938.1 hypothetical protein O1Q96_20390 [Streptomyces aurantiacus]